MGRFFRSRSDSKRLRGGLFERRVENDSNGVAFDPNRRPAPVGQTLDLGFGSGHRLSLRCTLFVGTPIQPIWQSRSRRIAVRGGHRLAPNSSRFVRFQ